MNKKRLMAKTLVLSIAVTNVLAGTTVFASTAFEGQKEEVVYIMTDAQGKVNNVNVVNIFGKGKVTDYGDYSTVKMLTSTSPITQDGDVISFSTDQDKVYYQGTMENVEIPWSISVTYTLDGKDVLPEELAGQSGALGIHIQITENTKCRDNYFDNYALQVNLALDTAQCKNILAEQATLANVGADKQISYTVLPGKGLDAEITADVTEFEMAAITINGIKLNFNVEINDTELMDKVTEIMDATKKLNDGAIELSDGANKLSDGGNNLNEGANSLYKGAGTLDHGIATLSQGIATMQAGLNTLNSKSETLTSGSKQVLDTLTTIQSSLTSVSVSTEQLEQLTGRSASIKQGISNLYNGAVTLQTNLSYESYKAAMNQNGLDLNQLKAGNSAAIKSLSEQIANLRVSLEQLKSIPGYESNQEYAAKVSALENQITSLSNIVTLLTGNNAAIGGTETYFNTVSSGVASLVKGLSDLKTSYETFDSAIVSLTNRLSGLVVNMSTLKSGIDQLANNYKTLDTGINEYTSGVATVVTSYSQLVNGVSTLASGSKELLEGAGTLKQGTVELYDGIVTLCDGTTDLHDGTSEFYEKTLDMDTQVEDSIDEMIASISGDETEIVSFVSEKNKKVESVQFVIKTATIEKEDVAEVTETVTQKMNFWEKLLNLFGL